MFTAEGMRDNVVQCIDILTGQPIATLSAHVRKIRCLAFRHDFDPELFTAADDGFVLRWRYKSPDVDQTGVEVDDEDYWSS